MARKKAPTHKHTRLRESLKAGLARQLPLAHNYLAIREQLTRNVETSSKLRLAVYYRAIVFPREWLDSTCATRLTPLMPP